MSRKQKIALLRKQIGYFDNYIEPVFLERRFPGKRKELITTPTAAWILVFIWIAGVAFLLWEVRHAL